MSYKVYLSFDKYEDSEALRDAMNGSKYRSFVNTFDQEVFRRVVKYGDTTMLDGVDDKDHELVCCVVSSVRKLFWEMLEDGLRDE